MRVSTVSLGMFLISLAKVGVQECLTLPVYRSPE